MSVNICIPGAYALAIWLQASKSGCFTAFAAFASITIDLRVCGLIDRSGFSWRFAVKRTGT